MPIETRIDELVKQLRRVDLRPPERLVKQILSYGEAARGPLLALATDVALLKGTPPDCWGPLHALRLLGELPDASIIEPLLRMLPIELYELYEGEGATPAHFWFNDLAQILARVGAPAFALLWAWVDEVQHNMGSRGIAIETQAYLTVVAPELREVVLGELRERLAREEDPVIAAYIVNALSGLAAGVAYNEVMAAYRAGRIDQEIMPAATARKLLLGKARPELACALHPIWERYDQHGPHAREE